MRIYLNEEKLEKALDKSKLVQVERQVQGKNGTFTRKQWVKASEVKKTDVVIGGQQPAKKGGKTTDKWKRPAKIGDNFSTLLGKSGGVPESLSNMCFGLSESIRQKKYSHVADNIGYKDQTKVINYIISQSDYSADGIARALNQSGVTWTNWKASKDTDDMIVVECTDRLGNVNTLRVYPRQAANKSEAQVQKDKVSLSKFHRGDAIYVKWNGKWCKATRKNSSMGGQYWDIEGHSDLRDAGVAKLEWSKTKPNAGDSQERVDVAKLKTVPQSIVSKLSKTNKSIFDSTKEVITDAQDEMEHPEKYDGGDELDADDLKEYNKAAEAWNKFATTGDLNAFAQATRFADSYTGANNSKKIEMNNTNDGNDAPTVKGRKGVASQLSADDVKSIKYNYSDKDDTKFTFETPDGRVVKCEDVDARTLKPGNSVLLHNGMTNYAGVVEDMREVTLDEHHPVHAMKAIELMVTTADGKSTNGFSGSNGKDDDIPFMVTKIVSISKAPDKQPAKADTTPTKKPSVDAKALVKKMSSDQAEQFAKDNNITWTKNDHSGINTMRMKMAIQLAIEDGSVEAPDLGNMPSKPTKADKSSTSAKKPQDDAKKAVQDAIGKNPDRAKAMEKFKANGITWKESNKEGINWMRAMMAATKHVADGGKIEDKATDGQPKTDFSAASKANADHNTKIVDSYMIRWEMERNLKKMFYRIPDVSCVSTGKGYYASFSMNSTDAKNVTGSTIKRWLKDSDMDFSKYKISATRTKGFGFGSGDHGYDYRVSITEI